MKIQSICFRLLLLSSLWLLPPSAPADESETNSEPVRIVIPELGELRDELNSKLNSIQRSSDEANSEAAAKWKALVEQNAALSNRLAGLQETILVQKERELELGRQSYSFNLKAMAGAAGAVIVLLLVSYWFQLRCFNRVLEVSRSLPALPDGSRALIEDGTSPNSKLLEAMKVLEHRVQQLEVPGATASSNGVFTDSTPARPAPDSATILHPAPIEAGSDSNVSFLLAKGDILLDMDRFEEAVNCFDEALAIDATNADAHLKKGIALERMNRLELSLSSYEEALRLNPTRAFGYVHKARVLTALHRYNEALSVYDSALGKNTAISSSTTTWTS